MSISLHRHAAQNFQNFFLVLWVVFMLPLNFEAVLSIIRGDPVIQTRHERKGEYYLKDEQQSSGSNVHHTPRNNFPFSETHAKQGDERMSEAIFEQQWWWLIHRTHFGWEKSSQNSVVHP